MDGAYLSGGRDGKAMGGPQNGWSLCRLRREKCVAMFSSERNCLRRGSLGRDGETGRLG